MKIGFIGTGVMGSSMVKNLLKAGHEVNVYNRTSSKAKVLEEYGAIFKETIEDCVKNVDIVFTIVGYPNDVKEVYDVVLENIDSHTIICDMTTSKPSLAIDIYNKAKEKGIASLDAPVSGGDVGAKNGTLTIMVGGDQDVYEKVKPVFLAMGTTINYIGGAGSGQHCKMSNQIAIAGTLAGDMEAITYAIKQGLSVQIVLDAITKGAAGSAQFDSVAKRVLIQNFEPGFYLKHFIKDMNIAIEESHNKDFILPILEKVCEMCKELESQVYEDLGTQVLYRYYNN